jgi:hypothetical protein
MKAGYKYVVLAILAVMAGMAAAEGPFTDTYTCFPYPDDHKIHHDIGVRYFCDKYGVTSLLSWPKGRAIYRRLGSSCGTFKYFKTVCGVDKICVLC